MKNVHTRPGFGLKLALLALGLFLALNGSAQAEPAPVAEAGTCVALDGATLDLDDLVILAAGELLAEDFPPRLEGALGETTRVPVVETVAQATDQTTRRPAREFGYFNEREREFISWASGLCKKFTRNDYSAMRDFVKEVSPEVAGREMRLEEVYLGLRCNAMFAQNIDLIRLAVEDPVNTKRSVKNLIIYFTEDARPKGILEKILLCKRDFGYGCLDVFGHLERKLKEVRESPVETKYLKRLKRNFHRNLNPDLLERDVAFCQNSLDEPLDCTE